jgi:hypothetical protein
MLRIIVVLFLIVSLTQSCTVAKLNSLPKSASSIDFNKCPIEKETNKGKRRTSKTVNEYCILKTKACLEEDVLKAIEKALKLQGFSLVKLDKKEKIVFAQRDLRANEWQSYTGVYYKIDENLENTRIYIQVRITQDFTGGRDENRAEKIGLIIEKEL